MFNAGVDTDLDNLHKIGDITDHIAEASDASVSGATVEDGKSGDTAFPHGDMKVLAVSLIACFSDYIYFQYCVLSVATFLYFY